ncbi:ATP-binding cassette domain-containing protein, partial [Acinetobacter baumannii]
FMIISHDRAFLRALTRATMWIDRGVVRRQEKGFEHFEEWRDKVWEDEDMQRHKLNRKIKAEARWAVEGISARRKRNQGRVRALGELRAERASQINRQGAAAMALDAGTKSGRKVIEAEGITKVYGDKVILNPFDITVMRGDRIALVGPNGVGKTTLLNMMIGKETPDSGTIKLGTNLEIALFDQARAQLDPDMSLWDSLTGDPDMRVSGKADQVMVRGAPKHVIGYLKGFLVDEAQARAPVRSLSGGERARLLLAKIMAKPSNMLVLDEPMSALDEGGIQVFELLLKIIGFVVCRAGARRPLHQCSPTRDCTDRDQVERADHTDQRLLEHHARLRGPGVAKHLGDLGALLDGQLQRVLTRREHHADVIELSREVGNRP